MAEPTPTQPPPSVEVKDAYWEQYYASAGASTRPLPSQFATFVAGELPGRHRVVEFGCGNGRDSLFFSSYGHDVVGTDGAEPAIKGCAALAERLDADARFVHSDIDDPGLASRVGTTSDPTVVYARFFLHAITEAEEASFFDHAVNLTNAGDLMAVEYRTVRDLSQTKVTERHYRRFMDPVAFMTRAAQRGFEVSYAVEGFGFAKYKEDDAYVARCILRRA